MKLYDEYKNITAKKSKPRQHGIEYTPEYFKIKQTNK